MELVVIAKQRTIKQILRVSETGRAELYFVHFFRCFYILAAADNQLNLLETGIVADLRLNILSRYI